MSIEDPIGGADSSSNNALDVGRLFSIKKPNGERRYRTLIQRRTGGLDWKRGKWVPFVDSRFWETERAARETALIRGDYAFPVSPDYIDLDTQVDAFLHSGPTDFDGRLIAIDYELYGTEPEATIGPRALKEFCRLLLKETGPRHLLMYAGKSFWEEPPHSGVLSDYGERVHLWNPWYYTFETQEEPWTHYERGLRHSGWWQRYAGGSESSAESGAESGAEAGRLPVCAQFCIGRAAGIPLDINAWRIDLDAIHELTREKPSGKGD
jgi:hypothetical protein